MTKMLFEAFTKVYEVCDTAEVFGIVCEGCEGATRDPGTDKQKKRM